MERDQPPKPTTLNYASARTGPPRRLAPTIIWASVAVIVLLPVTVAFFIPQFGHGPGSASVDLTKANMGGLTSPIELFRQAMGRYPRNLKELYNMPAGDPDAQKWTGPYVDSTEKLKDAWGRTLCYKAPGVHNSRSYDLWSMGKDGVSGTSEDICNWR